MAPKGKTLDELLKRESAIELVGQLPDGSPVYYNHKDRHTINKKLWLSDRNDIFFFLKHEASPWKLAHAMVVREESFRSNQRWMEGHDVKFLKKEGTFEYNSQHDLLAASHSGPSSSSSEVLGDVSRLPPVNMTVNACRMHRLPLEVPRDSLQVQLLVLLIFTQGSEPSPPDSVMSLMGQLYAIEGTHQDVKGLLDNCQNNPLLRPHVHVLIGCPFSLTYRHNELGGHKSTSDGAVERSPLPSLKCVQSLEPFDGFEY